MPDITPFQFKTKLDLTVLLGRKACNARDLLDGIREVPNASIYFHTHKFLQQHHYLSPEPPNDFAYWVTNVLNETILGEKLSSVDIIQFRRVGDLRNTFITRLDDYLRSTKRVVDAPEGEEFYFMSSQTFVLNTAHVANSLAEFISILGQVSIQSIYYHMFDAHLRLEHEENDYSMWFRQMGKEQLADAVRNIDPYTQTLEGLRRRIIYLVNKYANS